jgi:UDP-glucose 6-dehydrogenase
MVMMVLKFGGLAKKSDQDALFAALKKNNLEVGFLTAGHESNYEQHINTFKNMVNAACKEHGSTTFIYQLPLRQRLFLVRTKQNFYRSHNSISKGDRNKNLP